MSLAKKPGIVGVCTWLTAVTTCGYDIELYYGL